MKYFPMMNTIAMMRNTMDILNIQPQVSFKCVIFTIIQENHVAGGHSESWREKTVSGGVHGIWQEEQWSDF